MQALAELALAYRYSRRVWSPAQAMLGRDRRVFLRVPLTGACRIKNTLFGMEASGQMVNLGMGGVGVTAPVDWPEGSAVRVDLSDLGFEVDGLMVFRKESSPEHRYGIQFQKLSIRQLLRLRKILKRHHHGPLAVV